MDQAYLESQALLFIESELKTSVNPVVWCSFGKESLIVLHMVRQFIPTVPVISIRYPKFHEKYRNVEKVSMDWNLEVHNLMPQASTILQLGLLPEIIDLFEIEVKHLTFVVGTEPAVNDEDSYCGIDLLARPKSVTPDYKWDRSFFGCRRADSKSCPTADKINEERTVQSIIYPIYDWDSAAVWKYVDKYQLPIDKDRYFNITEKNVDPDHLPTCVNCFDKNKAGTNVWCHKLGTRISNIVGE